MAVRVTLNKASNTLEFRPETAEDSTVADYLSGLVNQSKANVAKSAGPASFNRAKADLLINQAEAWEKKAHDGTYNLAKDVQDYYSSKAREARKLAKELLGE